MTTAASSASGTTTATKRLRVLCLHGFRTNADILDMQLAMSVFHTPKIHKLVDLVCVSAPHRTVHEQKVPAVVREAFGAQRNGYREWWNRNDATGVLDGKEETMQYLRNLLRTGGSSGPVAASQAQNPAFDGILGFSQGGAASLLLLQELYTPDFGVASPTPVAAVPHSCRPKFGVILSAFAPKGLELPSPLDCTSSEDENSGMGVSDKELTLRTLPMLFMGQKDDQDVALHRLRAVAQRFANSVLIENPEGGHKIAGPQQVGSEHMEQIFRFFRARWQERFGVEPDSDDENMGTTPTSAGGGTHTASNM
ncbi:unnamed protein product [Amoebophrya sp. A120]|nr:unnamed protein product [Amoebophrya sp. A120]|eukprot:GSA120T00011755001.1